MGLGFWVKPATLKSKFELKVSLDQYLNDLLAIILDHVNSVGKGGLNLMFCQRATYNF